MLISSWYTLHLETAPQKKPYEISYKVKSVQELQAEQKEAVEKVVGLLECDVSGIRACFRVTLFSPHHSPHRLSTRPLPFSSDTTDGTAKNSPNYSGTIRPRLSKLPVSVHPALHRPVPNDFRMNHSPPDLVVSQVERVHLKPLHPLLESLKLNARKHSNALSAVRKYLKVLQVNRRIR